MKGEHLFHAEQVIDFLDGRVPAFLRANVVARREKMRGVETHAEAFWLVHFVEHSREVRDAMPEASALSRRVLECDAHRRTFRGAKCFIQPGDDLISALLFAGA